LISGLRAVPLRHAENLNVKDCKKEEQYEPQPEQAYNDWQARPNDVTWLLQQ
jgi:hypothetical protein